MAFTFKLLCLICFFLLISYAISRRHRDFHRLQIVYQPKSQMVSASFEKVFFKCRATPDEAEITWFFNGKPIDVNDSKFNVTKNKLTVFLPTTNSNESNNHRSLTVSYNFASDGTSLQGSTFQCQVKYKNHAIISEPAKLIIAFLSFFPNQEDIYITAFEGNTVVIPCSSPHSIPYAITEFMFNGTKIHKFYDRYVKIKSGNLQILDSRLSDSGTYYCIAYNPFLEKRVNSSRRIFLIVKQLSEAKFLDVKDLKFAVTPKPYLATVRGANITLECVAQSIRSPYVTWYKLNGSLPAGRYKQIGGNLELFDLNRNDEGTYICKASLVGFSPINTSVLITVQSSPEIVEKLQDKKMFEGQELSYDCIAKGKPKPIITWMLNGNRLTPSEAFFKGIMIKGNDSSKLYIEKADHRHSGIYQCFASNELGSTYSLGRVRVASLKNENKDRDNSNHPLENFSRKVKDDDDDYLFGNRQSNGRKRNKKNKGVKMVPPTKPEVSRLSEDSVMVRWDVPSNDGLPISFFKVQYKEISKAKSHWNTLNDDIAPHIKSYTVSGLKSGAKYIFRIAAAYSNHDNREGPNSEKFLLLKTPTVEKPTLGPTIIDAVPESQSSIYLTWEYLNIDSIPSEGFFIHYRATSSAGDYHKITVNNANVKTYVISHLAPNTAYEIKMQCFNKAGASEFSNIFVSKTAKNLDEEIETISDNEVNILIKDLQPVGSDNDYKFYIILGISICVSFVVLVVCTILQCLRVRKVSNQRAEASSAFKISKETNFNSNLNSNLKNVNHNFSNHHSLGYYYSSHHKSVNTISNSISVPSINSSKLNGFKMNEKFKDDKRSIKDSKDIHIQFNSFKNNTLSTRSNDTIRNENIRRDNFSLRSSVSHSALHSKHLYDNNFNNVNTLEKWKKHEDTHHSYHHHHHYHHHHPPPPPPPPLPLSNHHRFNSRSSSFTRLNGTLERKRRSRTDLITAFNSKENESVISRCNGLLKTNSSTNGSIVIMQSSC